MKYLFAISFSIVFLIACENENESKYSNEKETDIDTATTDSLFANQIAAFPFEKDIRDQTDYSFPLAFSGEINYKTSKGNAFALAMNISDYLQFLLPNSDTVSFTCFIKNDKTVDTKGASILNLDKKATIDLDVVSSATYITINNSTQSDVLNTYKNWLFVYVELIKNNSTIKLIVKNKESSTAETYSYNVPLSAPLTSGDMIRIGSSFTNKNGFKGSLDNLKVFARTLSPDEIEFLYKHQ